MIETKITQRLVWTPDLITLRLDHLPGPFQAGQFFNLASEADGSLIRRSYSAASAPGEPLEFFLSRVEGGALTPLLFALKEGDSLLLDPKPLGFFTLAEVPEAKRLWVVATGTGLGPFISMLRSEGVLARFEQVVVVHGVRHKEQLAYRAELSTLSAESDRIRYVPVVSGPGETSTNGELLGRITSVFADGRLIDEAGSAFDQNCHMLMCGNPQMITDMAALLKDAGFEKHRRREPGHFNFEKYW
jgi:ferredoxin--NADP+ reductase